MARVFISYRRVAPYDRVADAIHRTLGKAGHDAFLDVHGVALGEAWARKITEAAERADFFIALLSAPYFESDHCEGELRIALARHRKQQTTIVPISVAYGGRLPTWVRDELGAIQTHTWQDDDDTAATIDRVATIVGPVVSLVRGMRPFERTDHEAFPLLERDAELATCLAAVDASSVLLYGVSGAGKTSFVRAGLLPRLPADAWQELTVTSTDALDIGAFDRPRVLLDQFEQVLAAWATRPDVAHAFDAAALTWLDAEPARRLVFVIRDEYRTPFGALLPLLADRTRGFALLPLGPEAAARVLAAILASAKVARDDAFVAALPHHLAEGVPRLVRPAMLQLIAHEAVEAQADDPSACLDASRWGIDAAADRDLRREFFARHVRTTVLDLLPPGSPRLAAARALRGLTQGQLKDVAHTAAEVAAADKDLALPDVERAFALAAAPHARIASAEPDGTAVRFRLVHDLFARAIHDQVTTQEAAAERHTARRRRAILVGVLAIVAIAAVVASVFGIRASRARRASDEARAAADAQSRRTNAARLAVLSQQARASSPSAAYAFAAEGALATAPDGMVTAEVVRAVADAVQALDGPILPGSSGRDASLVALSSRGSWVAAVHDDGIVLAWKLEPWPTRVTLLTVTKQIVFGVTFVDDGPQLVVVNNLGVWLLDASAPQAPPRSLLDLPRTFTVSHDGEVMAAISGDDLHVWSLRARDPAHGHRRVKLPGPGDIVHQLELSPTGEYAAWLANEPTPTPGPVNLMLWTMRLSNYHYDHMPTLLAQFARSLHLAVPVWSHAPLRPLGLDPSVDPVEPTLLAITDSGVAIVHLDRDARGEGLFDEIYATQATGDGKPMLLERQRSVLGNSSVAAVWREGSLWPLIVFGNRVCDPQVSELRDRCRETRGILRAVISSVQLTSEAIETTARSSAGGDITDRVATRGRRAFLGRWTSLLSDRDGVALYAAGSLSPVHGGPEPERASREMLTCSQQDVTRCGPCRSVLDEQHRLLAASVDGRRAAIATPTARGSAVSVWSCAGAPREIASAPERRDVFAAALSPDERWLAIAGRAGDVGTFTVELWTLTGDRLEHRATLDVDFDQVVSRLQFRADSRQLLAAAHTKGTLLWDIDQFRPGGRSIALPGDWSLSYSADGRYLLDQWRRSLAVPVTLDAILEHGARIGVRNLTLDEWRSAAADAPYRRTFPALPDDPAWVEDAVRRGHGYAQRDPIAAMYSYASATGRALDLGDPVLQCVVCASGTRAGFARIVEPACRQAATHFAWEETARAVELHEAAAAGSPDPIAFARGVCGY